MSQKSETSPNQRTNGVCEAKIDWRAIPLGALGIAFAAWGLSNMDQSLFGYALPDLMTAFKIGLGSIGLIISASFAFGVVASIGVGVLTDLWGAKRTLPLCLAISAILVGLQASPLLWWRWFSMGGWQLGFSVVIAPALVFSGIIMLNLPKRVVE